MSKLIVNEIEKYDAGQLTITTGTNVSIGSDLTVGGALAGTLSTAAQPNVTSVGTLSSLAVSGDLTVDTSTLKVDSANNFVGIGSTSNVAKLHIQGGDTISSLTDWNTKANTAFTLANPSLRLGIGYNASDIALIQGFDVLNAARNISLQPYGGNVGIGMTPAATVLLDLKEPDAATDLIIGLSAGTGGRAQIRSVAQADGTSAEISFHTVTGGSTSERFRITPNGVTFNGDTAAANALDDYEEGTWTMGISFNFNSVGVTYSNSTGSYTKVGRKVTVTGYVSLTNKGTSTGNARIFGLPFPVPFNAEYYSAGSFHFNGVSHNGFPHGWAQTNSSDINLGTTDSSGTFTGLTNADFTNTSGIILSLTYFVD
jgi:hypothetical protein